MIEKVANSAYAKNKSTKQIMKETQELEAARKQDMQDTKDFEAQIAALEKEMRQLEEQDETLESASRDLSSKLVGFEQVIEQARSKSEVESSKEKNDR